MRQQLIAMLELQDKMNQKVHPEWILQKYEWYRAVWIECAELMDHQGYKWWKKQQADIAQVQLEVVDIWHFGMSALFDGQKSYENIADDIMEALESYNCASSCNVHLATEALAAYSLTNKSFCIKTFWQLMEASGLNFEQLYKAYIGKNVLNFFRQDHGYKAGTYIKNWDGKEDNEHLAELVETLDSSAAIFRDALYDALSERYKELCSEPA